MAKYKRVLIKLSGEALADKNKNEIFDAANLKDVAEAIKSVYDSGVQICIVVGGGNIWRGKLADSIGVEKSTADYMGMLGTIMNALAIQSALSQVGIISRVMSAIEVNQVCEPYIKKKAVRHLEKGRVVIFAGGTGNPFFTTDTAAALRAKDTDCEAILMAKNGVEGVYTADPRTDKSATLIKDISYSDMLAKNLKVMDNAAVALLMDTNIELRVFNMADTSNFKKVAEGKDLGTTIRKD
jgi:uridylate kinase